MRNLVPLLTTMSVLLGAAGLGAACGDEASSVRGSWNVERMTIGFAENLECTGLEDQQTEDAGTMAFDDTPHPDGIAEHTFTYSLSKVVDAISGELVDADPAFAGTAGWTPDDGEEDTDGFIVDDPENASMSGVWNILESAFGAVNVEHFTREGIPDEGPRCIRSEYFLVAP